ncbi:MAG: AAA family ATPase, partial [Myxococcota bacterium]
MLHRDPLHQTLIGRAHALKQIERAEQAGERLITLLGPAGIGKTALARHLMAQRHAPFCLWLRLAEVDDLDGMVIAMVRALRSSLHLQPDAHGVEQLGETLEQLGAGWVVLDNVEHVLDPVREAMRWWFGGSVRWLLTSQRRIEHPQEWCLRLTELTLEERRTLFIRSARRVAAAPDSKGLDGLLRRLGGIPLHIELAASRALALTPQQMTELLDADLAVLARQASGVEPRHMSAERALEWSWGLLSRSLQVAAGHAALFRGAFEVDDLAPLSSLDAREVLLALGELCERAWLSREGERYRMPHTARLFVLHHEPPDTALRNRYHHHLTARVTALAAAQHSAKRPQVLDGIEALAPDLLQALARSDLEPAQRAKMTLGVHPWMQERGPGELHQRLVDKALAAGPGLPEQAALLLARGLSLYTQGRLRRARADMEALAALCGHHSELDPRLRAQALQLHAALLRDDPATQSEARALVGALRTLADELDDPFVALRAAFSEAALCASLEETERSAQLFGVALSMAREQGAQHIEALALSNLGAIALDSGRWETALAQLTQGYEALIAADNRASVPRALIYRCVALMQLGRLREVETLLLKARAEAERYHDQRSMAQVDLLRVELWIRQGRVVRARELLGRLRVAPAVRELQLDEHVARLEEALQGLPGERLVVDAARERFQLSGREQVSLARRGAQRRIFQALVEAHG